MQNGGKAARGRKIERERERERVAVTHTHTHPGNTDVSVCATKTRSCTSKLGKSWLLFPATLLLVWTELKVYAINFFAILFFFLFISQGIPLPTNTYTHTHSHSQRGDGDGDDVDGAKNFNVASANARRSGAWQTDGANSSAAVCVWVSQCASAPVCVCVWMCVFVRVGQPTNTCTHSHKKKVPRIGKQSVVNSIWP